jgi:hypothetical protein
MRYTIALHCVSFSLSKKKKKRNTHTAAAVIRPLKQ